jgi:hypothetical protein
MVIHALGALRFHFGATQRGQQHGGENGNDGNDHQQFDQRERAAPPSVLRCSVRMASRCGNAAHKFNSKKLFRHKSKSWVVENWSLADQFNIGGAGKSTLPAPPRRHKYVVSRFSNAPIKLQEFRTQSFASVPSRRSR